jgi:hypothetical protein
MLTLSATLFCLAAVATLLGPQAAARRERISHSGVGTRDDSPTRPSPLGGPLSLLLGAFGLLAAVTELGALRGLIVLCVVLMTALSALVLLLAPRPDWARPTAIVCSALGLLLAGLNLVGGGL